jgi:S1-C subfamily serine protease
MATRRGADLATICALLLGAPMARAGAPADARGLSRAFSATVGAIGPAVVRVEPRVEPRTPGDGAAAPAGTAAGSGLVIDTAGNVVTLARLGPAVVDVWVVFADGAREPARAVGTDWLTGVTVVRLTRAFSNLTAARFGDSDVTEVGDWALAVGRGAGADVVVGAGIIGGRVAPAPVSAVSAPGGRGYFVIDAGAAADSPGGPLVNLEGEVIGLCATPQLAIPINQLRRATQMILADGRAHYPYMGVALRDVRDLDRGERARLALGAPLRGALVSHIWDGAPAARAGLRAGDVITAVDNQETPAIEDVVEQVSLHSVGETLTVGFVRGGSARSAKVSLGDLPAWVSGRRRKAPPPPPSPLTQG